MDADAPPAIRPIAERLSRDPSDTRHVMRLKPVRGTARALYRGETLAASSRALWCLEIDRDFHEPILYFPLARVSGAVKPSRHIDHCPIKGERTSYRLIDGMGRTLARDIAWSYTAPTPCAARLFSLIAFDATRITLEVAPPVASLAARTRD